MAFFFDPFAKPLLDHALIVEVARTRKPLDAGQHPGVKTERDGRGLTGIRLEQGTVHQAACAFALPQLSKHDQAVA